MYKRQICVNVSLLLCHVTVELIRVRQVTIVGNANTMRIVRVKRLCFCAGAASSCGVSHVANSDVAFQFSHVMLLKDISNQTIILSKVEAPTLGCNHTSCILTAMLQNGQTIEQKLVYLKNKEEEKSAFVSTESRFPRIS